MNPQSPDLDPLFAPESVAIVGASPDSWYSSQLVENLLEYGFDGALHLVNPGREAAWDRPCHDTLADVPERPELVVVSVPREVSVEVVEEAGEMGVPAALVITAGFSEADDDGAQLETDLAAVANEHEIRVCGPNCIGVMDAHAETVLTSTCSRTPEPGSIGLISQSGALAFTTFFERAADEAVHFSKIVSTGNEADLTLSDYIEYFHADSTVDVICAYIEGVEHPRRFLRAADAAVRDGTSLLVVKVGRSGAAEAATLSHTGSLTGNDAAWEGAFSQVGIERVPDIPDLLGRARAHATFDAPKSNRVCIASTSGGLASLLADLATERDLSLPDLAGDVESTLLDMDELLTFGELHNPLDIRGYGADHLPEITDELFADDFDSYVFAIGLSAVDERAAAIADDLLTIANATSAPVFVLWTGRKTPAELDDPQPIERLRRVTPVYEDPTRCLDALASLVRSGEHTRHVANRPTRTELDSAAESTDLDVPADTVLPWADASELLSGYGIDLVPTKHTESAEEAVEAAHEFGFPVVLKSDSPDVPHRTAADAVRVGMTSEAETTQAYGEIVENVREHVPGAALSGVLVQPQLLAGIEAMVGVSHDPDFGPLVTVASGGTLVETLDDATLRVPPLSTAEARDAIETTRIPGIADARLDGTVGLDALADVLAGVGRLASAVDAISELDLNPVVVCEDGAVAVDALVRTH